MNRNGPGPQPLRNVNNVFQNQQSTNSRQPSLTSARLQNGKIANAPSWGYGGLGGAAAPQGAQSRPGGLSSFAQTIGGGHSQASLDLADFPSLSGAPQTQQTSSSQSAWRSSGSGAANTNPPVQRPTTQGSQNNMQAPGLTPQQLGPGPENVRPSPFDGATSSVDSFRYEDQGTIGRDPRRSDQQGTRDDFPPLGVSGGIDSRQGVGQTYLQGLGAGASFLGAQGSRSAGFATDGHTDGLAPNGAGGRIVSPSDAPSASRSPLEMHDDLSIVSRHQSNVNARIPQTGSESITLPYRGGPAQNSNSDFPARYPSGEQPPQQSNSDNPNGTSATPTDSHSTNGNTHTSDLDRYGLQGLLTEMRNITPDQATFRLGTDLNQLGLDVNRQGPLHVDWAGPFADQNTRPVVPDFRLPPAYTVQGVPPLEEKLPSFSDETLFTIFYSLPRDKAQELAASELYNRDWRWHKRMQQWMMKAKEFGEPVQLPSQKEERGWYYFFDLQNWKRERKEFILNYEHLYHPSERVGIAGTF